ncbi:CLUMA_CG002298, isoform A [Clunio marinus]|uniref:CLUMA_CG002298, isoform A n=1 Tax=Clunio marinus TaxID=568069 RepID=A0A1J1HQS4_9DIPT|nr:CLUMA_CG002298, isoform A [Clunio marinus]
MLTMKLLLLCDCNLDSKSNSFDHFFYFSAYCRQPFVYSRLLKAKLDYTLSEKRLKNYEPKTELILDDAKVNFPKGFSSHK